MSFTDSDVPTPATTKQLIDLLTSTASNKSGFQRAHVVGEAFADRPELTWFRWVLGSKEQDSRVNGVLAPQTQRGGAILGVAVHFSEHEEEFNQLFFQTDEVGLDESKKW